MVCPSIFPTNSDYTKIVVLRVNDFSYGNNILSGSNGHALFMASTRYPKLFQLGTFTDSYVPMSDGYSILTGTFQDASLNGRIWVDGKFGAGGYASGHNLDSTLVIAAYAGVYPLNGEISEILVYDRALDSTERAGVEQYLSRKYGVSLYTAENEFPFTHFPVPLQFYARGDDDSATVRIAATVSDPGFDSVRLDMFRDGGYWKSLSRPLEYEGTDASFMLEPKIYARPVEFGFRVYLVSGGRDSLIGVRDSIVCGDAILITGQSNSTPANGLATYSNEFCRTFGVQAGYSRYEPSDTIWGFANGNSAGRFLAGVWGLKLQQLILERYGVPTCVILGGVGGSSIEINQRNDADSEDLNTIYGRTLYRARKAGVAGDVRFLFWYQGESNTITNYYENFKSLYDDWRTDYPSLKKFYVVQIRPGCAVTNPHLELRDLLRTLGDSLADVVPVSATGIPGHDGCHYTYEGYNVLGTQVFRLVARDFYGSDDTVDVASPNLTRAYYSSAEHDEITLIFDPPSTVLRWPDDTVVAGAPRRMSDYFYLDGASGAVQEGSVAGNRIILKLSAPSTASGITYIPDHFYNDTELVYEGPWITNRRGVGALTFYNVEIATSETGVGDSHPLTVPSGVMLRSIAPNPTASTAVVRFSLEREGVVDVALYDMLAREVLVVSVGRRLAGEQEFVLSTTMLPIGAYRCVIRSGDLTSTGVVSVVR